MEQDFHSTYLETQIATATPQRLRLMLIDGAIRFARQAIQAWQQSSLEQADEALVRCRAIIAELLSSIKADEHPAARQTAALYLYLFKALADTQLQSDYAGLGGVIEVLEVERETWEQVCRELPEAPVGPTEQVAEITARDMAAIPTTPLPQSASWETGARERFDSGAMENAPPRALPNLGIPTTGGFDPSGVSDQAISHGGSYSFEA